MADLGISQERVMEELRAVEDPDVRMSIVDLGLVYRVEVGEDQIDVDFTLTYPGCPLGDQIQNDIVETLKMTLAVPVVNAKVVWDPPWSPERMSEEARLMLGYPI